MVSLLSGAEGSTSLSSEPMRTSGHRGSRSGLLRVSVATDYNELRPPTLEANFRETNTLTGDIREVPTEQILSAAGLRSKEPVLVVGACPAPRFPSPGSG